MSTPGVALGPEAAVTVGIAGSGAASIAWGVIEGTYRDTGDDADTTDSFNRGNKNSKTGLTEFSADITMQRMGDVLEHVLTPPVPLVGGAYGLMVGNFIYLALFPYAITVPLLSYTVPYFRIRSWESNFRVKGSEPQTVRFSGVSSGNYFTPDGQRGGALLGIMPAASGNGP